MFSRAWPWLALVCAAVAVVFYIMWTAFNESDSPGEVPVWLGFGWVLRGTWDEITELISVVRTADE